MLVSLIQNIFLNKELVEENNSMVDQNIYYKIQLLLFIFYASLDISPFYFFLISNTENNLVLYIDLRPGQTCHSKVMHQKKVTHSDGSYEKKSRRRTWLTIWDKVKSHGTGIDWCTGLEWPVNYMTVISAWWRSNMPFQRLSGRLNYYITRWRQEFSELEIRWARDKMW